MRDDYRSGRAVVAKIVNGTRATSGDFLWYGPTWGTSFAGEVLGAGLGNTTATGSTRVGAPYPLVTEYLGTWVQQNPPAPKGTWDWTTTTYEQFDQLFLQSVEMFGSVIGTDNPDLSGFKKAGGRLVIYQGMADQLIYPQGTIDYYNRVQQSIGDRDTAGFARVFLAPGMGHCAGGPGPQPDKPLNQLVDWVEHGTAPERVVSRKNGPDGQPIRTRPLCPYPQRAVYMGSGSTEDERSFVCK